MDTLNEWLKPPIIWFAAGVLLLLLEFSSPGVVILFFGIGAWLTAVLCLFIDLSINMQLSAFILSSLFLLISLRKWFKRLLQGRFESNEAGEEVLSEFVGKKAVVTREITATGGKVEFQGSNWGAEAGTVIPQGTAVEIVGRNNITLIVKPLT
ncbi:MAG: NfeD family protein [Caldithrix sp.]|nr:MAG: NfeD family protein [Caldithrix sp.]